MCEVRACGALALAALLGATTATGQSVAEYHARLARLRAEQRRVLALAQQAKQVRPAGDTVRAGALTLIVDPALGPLARAIAPSAWRLLEAKFGDEARLVAPLEFTLQAPDVPTIALFAPDSLIHAVWLPREATTSAQAALILTDAAAQVIGAAQDAALRGWLQGTIDPRPQPPGRYAAVYVELATAPWAAVRSCHGGDVPSCERALGLETGPDPLDAWYATEDLRQLVETGPFTWGLDQLDDARVCTQQNDATACAAALRTLPREFVPPPLSPLARGLLVDMALELGGANAYGRLVHTPGPVASRLAVAAGVATDSLVRAWRARVFAEAPRPITLNRAVAWAAMFWGVAFAFLGLRSTRWR